MTQDGEVSAGKIAAIVIPAVTIFVALIILGMWGCPKYNVYQANLTGAAELAQAEQNRQIAVAQSKAKFEAAQYEAAADTMRALGVARANAIIGERLTGPIGDAYLRYLWIQGIENHEHVIYVPTEAGMPILEAGRSLVQPPVAAPNTGRGRSRQ